MEEDPVGWSNSLASVWVLRMNFQVSNFPVIEQLCHSPNQIVLLVLILGLAGFVSGMIGFGFASFGAAVLWILPPREGVPLLMLLSACSQILSIGQLRSSMTPLKEWWPQGPAPYVIGGWAGIPLGLWLLSHLDAKLLCCIIGLIVVGYSLWTIIKPSGMSPWKHTLSGALSVGLLGGVVGGFCASPGSVMVIWANLLGLNKEEQRAMVQPYILAMQLMALLIFALRGGVFSGCLGIIWGCSFIVILITTRLGVTAFRRLSNSGYNRLVMILLSISGVSLIAKGWGFWNELFAKFDHFVFSL
jgi:uncharacterized membrane protein YfcA